MNNHQTSNSALHSSYFRTTGTCTGTSNSRTGLPVFVYTNSVEYHILFLFCVQVQHFQPDFSFVSNQTNVRHCREISYSTTGACQRKLCLRNTYDGNAHHMSRECQNP
jgi:hypothetical protein